MSKNGFVNFPKDNYKKVSEKMWINLVVFDVLNATSKSFSEFADIHLFLDGYFLCDDTMTRPKINKKINKISIDELLKEEIDNQRYDNLYFPNLNVDYIQDFDLTKWISTPLMSSTVIGWSSECYLNEKTGDYWFCTFNDLSEEGKALYFLMKKLYNQKEIRILTFKEKEIF